MTEAVPGETVISGNSGRLRQVHGRSNAARPLAQDANQSDWSLLIGSRLALLAIGLLLALPASAITYVLPTDESLVDRTPTILYGRVLSATPAPGDLRLPATDFTFQVKEVLKGSVAASTVTVRQLGGMRPEPRPALDVRVVELERYPKSNPVLPAGESHYAIGAGASGCIWTPSQRVQLAA